MATRISTELRHLLARLRFEPTTKRVSARWGGTVVLDSGRAVLVWEPQRLLPNYAVPEGDVAALLSPAAGPPPASGGGGTPAMLAADTPFAVHLGPGEALDVSASGRTAPAAAFRPADPDLAGYVVFDFHAFQWYEEEEPIIAHPRDPFHRVDIRASSRHVRVSLNGRTLAETDSPTMVFETNLPARTYLPAADVNWPELAATDSLTACAYKGHAHYWAAIDGDGRDIAWSYLAPLPELAQLTGLICFYDERTDIAVDGSPQQRPRTPWS